MSQSARKPAVRSPEERALIDRAKAVLMAGGAFTEPDAYHAMRRSAMRRGRKLVDVARDVIVSGEREQSA